MAKEKSWSGERDRRLGQAEERAIRSVLAEKKGRNEELVLFEMALESAMRLREIYTLTWDQVDFVLRTLFLDKTKNGDKRQVPMSSPLLRVLREYKAGSTSESLFPDDAWRMSVFARSSLYSSVNTFAESAPAQYFATCLL